MNILENQQDLKLYKKLLRILSEYTSKLPVTGVNKLLDSALENGIKILPKDKQALRILNFVLNQSKSVPAIIQDLLNLRLVCLPVEFRPIYNVSGSKIVAFYLNSDKMGDKVIDLIDFNGSNSGYWSDEKRQKVNLLDLSEEE